MDNEKRAKYFIGWIDQSTLCKPGWYDSLIELSEVVERNGEELLLFRVPKGGKGADFNRNIFARKHWEQESPSRLKGTGTVDYYMFRLVFLSERV